MIENGDYVVFYKKTYTHFKSLKKARKFAKHLIEKEGIKEPIIEQVNYTTRSRNKMATINPIRCFMPNTNILIGSP